MPKGVRPIARVYRNAEKDEKLFLQKIWLCVAGLVIIRPMAEHKHLCRLERIWVSNPRYFITVCIQHRRKILARKEVAAILHEEWSGALERHGWVVGSYVIMPDHVHFFCTDAEHGTSLSAFIGKWKEWTSKRLQREVGAIKPVWQKGFFDHLLRSDESYSEKWEYVRQNPVRAGLVQSSGDWSWSGYIHYR